MPCLLTTTPMHSSGRFAFATEAGFAIYNSIPVKEIARRSKRGRVCSYLRWQRKDNNIRSCTQPNTFPTPCLSLPSVVYSHSRCNLRSDCTCTSSLYYFSPFGLLVFHLFSFLFLFLDIGGVHSAVMLFSTNIVAIVGGGRAPFEARNRGTLHGICSMLCVRKYLAFSIA